MSRRELKYVLMATFVGIVLFLAVSHFTDRTDDFETGPVPMSAWESPQTPMGQDSPVVSGSLPPATATETGAPTQVPDPQQQVRNEFQELIRLQVTLPNDFYYVNLDIDDKVAVLYGNQGSKELAVLATDSTASMDQVVSFLNDYKNAIPVLGGADFKITGDPQSISLPADSGLSNGRVIPGPVTKNSQLVGAYLERSDRKGSYFFIMRAEPEFFEHHDGFF